MKITLIIFFFFFGCTPDNQEYTNSYKIPKKPSINQSQGNHIPFKWTAPSHWLIGNQSEMRVASYLIPTANGSADLSVIYLNGDGGGVAANVNRWRKQLNLPNINLNEINEEAVSLKGKIGEYKIYEIINHENKDSGFLCAIIPAEEFTIFVKLNTYADNLVNLKNEFITFSSSVDYNE